ncbi:vasa intronic gene [Carabus blaptoides fortunei]
MRSCYINKHMRVRIESDYNGKTEVAPKGKVAVTQRKTIKESIHKAQDNKRDETKLGQKASVESRNDRNKTPSTVDNREERNNRRNREDRPFNGPSEGNRDERPRREFNANSESGDMRSRGGRGGVGRPRGGRGAGRIYDHRGKREFDRQSGSDKTGIKPVDKREGSGAHNWGSHKDIIEEVDKNEVDPSWELDKVETPAVPTEAKEPGPDGDAPTTEEEPKQFTLDEWRAQRANRQKPQYNLRKAGEGEDPTQWKKMYELSKKKEGEEEESDDEEYDASEYPQRVGRQKHVLDIDIHFNDSRGDREPRERQGPRPYRGGGGGGGAGGGTGGAVAATGNAGGTGGSAGTTVGIEPEVEEHVVRSHEHQHKGGRQNAPKVDDEHDFPSLS